MHHRKYFGTDGIRGRVGEGPVSAEFMLRLGRAAGIVLTRANGDGSVLIGKDTRLSGYMLESALEAGLIAAGARVRLLGPMPTPAVAQLTRSVRSPWSTSTESKPIIKREPEALFNCKI